MKLKYCIITLMLFCTNLLFAQDLRVTASVSKSTVGTGEQFEVSFNINGNPDSFTPPQFGGLQVLSGPNQSTSMTSINGATTVNAGLSYILMGSKIGTFTIGPATVGVNGKKLSTNPIKITVVKGQPVQQQQSQGQSKPQNIIEQGKPANLSKSLFIRAIADKNSVYQGQQINVSYRVYTRLAVEGSQADKIPDLNGFWSEDIKLKGQATMHIETYKGLQYEVADVKQTILFPEHSGDLTIDPLGMTFLVKEAAAPRNAMEEFFGGASKDVKYTVESAPVIIHVKPLPEAGKPDSFTGAVGKFTMNASVDKTELKTNETLNYKVTVTGSGNIKLLKDLSIVFPADFEKYDPKITDTVSENENGVSGSRFYNYLLIPRHQGDFTIEPLKFSYFNPATGKYVTLSSAAFHIKVNRGVNESNVTVFSGSDKQDVKLLDKDIRYIKDSSTGLGKANDDFFGSGAYWLLIVFGPLVCIGAFMYRNRQRKINSDVVKVKSRKASKVAAKHLENAQLQLTTNNIQAFYEAIFKGLYGYLSDKLNIQYANLDKETIASALKAKNLDELVINQLIDTLDLCEMARYAPVTHISAKEVFEKSKGIINDIEGKL